MPALDFGEAIERKFRLACVGQRHRDGKVGDRERVAQQISAAAEVIVQHLRELLEEAVSLLERSGIGFGAPIDRSLLVAQGAEQIDLP